MNSKSPKISNNAIYLPITAEIHQIARQFASRQPTTEKAEQILYNTIAVSVVNNYLTMLGIHTDLSNSDSWNSVMQLCNDTADLAVSGVGKLECRPVKSNRDSCYIPLEVWDLRIGYTVVKIDDDLRNAAILGFTPQVTIEELVLSNLRPPEALIDRIHELQESITDHSSINLGQWFNNIFETGWQTIDSIFTPQQLTPTFGFRNAELPNFDRSDSPTTDRGITRAKVINLGVQLSECNVILLVKLAPQDNNNIENDIEVTLQVHPQGNELYLPATLKLKVLEAPEQIFMEAQARNQDNYIQLQFSGQIGERFMVEITLDNITFTENFQL